MDRQLIFYADLNCPFCFAMNERLVSLGLDRQVGWRGVEHEPDLAVPWNLDADQQAELSEEMTRIADRAPEADVQRPEHRPNTRRAIHWLASVQPSRTSALRTALFRALWRQGLDISDPAVLTQLGEQLGIPYAAPTEVACGVAADWTRTWKDAGWNRIPVLQAADGELLLGLSTERAVQVFVGVGFSADTGLVCE